MAETIDSVLTSLTAQVDKTLGAEDSAIAFIKGVPALIATAVASAGLNSTQAQAFTDLSNKLTAKADELAAAIVANPA